MHACPWASPRPSVRWVVISKPWRRGKKCATDAKSGARWLDAEDEAVRARLSGWWIIWFCCRYIYVGLCMCACVGVWVCLCGCVGVHAIYIYMRISWGAPNPKRENPNKWRVWWRLLIYRVLFIKRGRWDVCEMYLFRRCK